MRARWTNLVAALTVWMSVAGTAAAQQPTLHDELLDRLVGRWTLTGTIAGRERTDDVAAEWTLNHQFVAVHEVSRERDADGRPAYQATAYVGWHEAKVSCDQCCFIVVDNLVDACKNAVFDEAPNDIIWCCLQ